MEEAIIAIVKAEDPNRKMRKMEADRAQGQRPRQKPKLTLLLKN